MKLSKTKYLHTFAFIVVILALARCVNDYQTDNGTEMVDSDSTIAGDTAAIAANGTEAVSYIQDEVTPAMPSAVAAIPQGGPYHRINSVPSFKETFPDSNDIQMTMARRYGVQPVQNRDDAEKRKAELVYAGANPYFHVDRLRESIPYLVPRANVLLQDIGRAFYDSLYIKGVPLHQIIVTSILRTEEDVERLRRHNGNASENSCHRFGTTFDICYNRYRTVQTKEQPRRQVQNDTLKWVLSEVLRDFRESGRCYVKYEVKQGCFHITTR